MAPDAAQLPVTEVVQPFAIAPEALDALAAPVPLTLFRSDTVRREDTAQTLLQRLGVSDREADTFLRNDPTARQLLTGRAGKLVNAQASDRGDLQRLTARWLSSEEGQFNRLVVERTDTGLQARLEAGDLQASTRLASGTIRSSLFAATDAVNLPDSVAVQAG